MILNLSNELTMCNKNHKYKSTSVHSQLENNIQIHWNICIENIYSLVEYTVDKRE